jgi:uncharacterized LabA/DUF88 family protein
LLYIAGHSALGYAFANHFANGKPKGFFYSQRNTMPTAILVDGAFFINRFRVLYGSGHSAEDTVKELYKMCMTHLTQNSKRHELYRIFFYDCPPLTKKIHHPISKKLIDFGKTDVAKFRTELHECLRRQRKVALRLGYLDDNYAIWRPRGDKLKELLSGKISLADLSPDDVIYEARQKGVDMRIGIDIASLAYKRQVDQIILVAGDSDFVPAAKLARREGIDFLLDPMWNPIRPDLHEHIDGLRSTATRAQPKSTRTSTTMTVQTTVVASVVSELASGESD